MKFREVPLAALVTSRQHHAGPGSIRPWHRLPTLSHVHNPSIRRGLLPIPCLNPTRRLDDTYLCGEITISGLDSIKHNKLCLYKRTCFILSLIVKLSLTKLPKMLSIWIQNQESKTYFYTLSMHTSAMECYHLLLNHEQHLSAGKESSDVACVFIPTQEEVARCPMFTLSSWTPWCGHPEHCPGGHHDVSSLSTVQVDGVGVTRCLSVNTDITAPNLAQYAAH